MACSIRLGLSLSLSLVRAGALMLTESILWLQALRIVTRLTKLILSVVAFVLSHWVWLRCNMLSHIEVFKVVCFIELVVIQIVLILHSFRMLVDRSNLIINYSKLFRLCSFFEGILSSTPLLL